MKTAYRIAEVAQRAGVSAATLRYYEQIGVLPAPARTASGYRMYDEWVVERLAFISRAKQLGCTLDEIADLSVAWDGGECGPIQDHLRTLVADKLAASREEIVALTRLTADLQRAASALERHRPVGACDDDCGCVAPAAVTSLTLGSKPVGQVAPVACTLSSDQMPERLTEWQNLMKTSSMRSSIPGGIRVAFENGVDVAALARLAEAEHACCAFFGFSITIDQRGVALEVTGPPETMDMVWAAFGAPE